MIYERIKCESGALAHLFHYGWEESDIAALVRFDPLADEVHHLLTAQHIPAHNTRVNFQI